MKAWLGPKTAKDREEDERLDTMQLEAPLPKSIAEYVETVYILQNNIYIEAVLEQQHRVWL